MTEIDKSKKTPVKSCSLYHHVECQEMKELRISLTEKGQDRKKRFSMLGLSSKETIRTGLKAVDASPFKTIFVVEEKSGEVLFALSKNEEYVAARGNRPSVVSLLQSLRVNAVKHVKVIVRT